MQAPGTTDESERDDRCDHLIVWYRPGSGPSQAVATARLLPPHANDASPRGTGLAADRLFGLMPLERLLNSTVELDQCAVRTDHRAGQAVSLLRDGISRYLYLTGYRYLLGAVPIDARDGGRCAAAFWDLALTRYLAPTDRRCRPRRPLPMGRLEREGTPRVPAALRIALRLGGKVCGPPALNDMSATADFLVLVDLLQAGRRDLRPIVRASN
jgi:putative hemolysin